MQLFVRKKMTLCNGSGRWKPQLFGNATLLLIHLLDLITCRFYDATEFTVGDFQRCLERTASQCKLSSTQLLWDNGSDRAILLLGYIGVRFEQCCNPGTRQLLLEVSFFFCSPPPPHTFSFRTL